VRSGSAVRVESLPSLALAVGHDFQATAGELNAALEAGWPGFEIGRRFPLSAVAEAHEHLEERRGPGRVVVMMEGWEKEVTPESRGPVPSTCTGRPK
jgi:hypothetical protein